MLLGFSFFSLASLAGVVSRAGELGAGPLVEAWSAGASEAEGAGR